MKVITLSHGLAVLQARQWDQSHYLAVPQDRENDRYLVKLAMAIAVQPDTGIYSCGTVEPQ